MIANHGIQLVIHVILARLLLPEYFGLIGMLLIFNAISYLIIDSGFSQALIRDQGTSQVDYSTVFFFNLCMAALLYGVIFLIASPISIFFGEPRLTALLRVFSLVLVVNSLGIIQRVILIKKVDFKTITKVNVIAVMLSGVTTVLVALNGFGVWSLVVNTLVMQSAQTICLWLFTKWIPSWTFNRASFQKFFKFGYRLMLSGLLDTFYTNIYFVIIGRFYSTTSLGYYTNAVKFRDLASLSIAIAVQRVTYPILSSIQDDTERLKFGYKKIIRTAAFINFPLLVGLAAIAHLLFGFLLEDKWLPSVVYFQWLCFAGMFYPLHAINLNILQVRGRSDLFLRLEIIKKAILTLLILLSLTLGLGIIGLIGAAVLNSFISLLVNTYYSAGEIDYSTGEQLLDLTPSFVISMIMGATVYLVGRLLPMNNLIEMLLLIALGISLYIVLSISVKLRELYELYHLFRPLVDKLKRGKTKAQN